MSNNSWKQYGGISKMDNFNTINASTIIADQFVSRSVRPTYQLLNGTFEVTEDLISGNSSYSNVDTFSNRDIYTNNKLFFGNNTFVKDGNNLPTLTDVQKITHAYLYGNDTNIGINTIIPKTSFNITGTVGSITDILTVESKNVLVRNIIAQNINQRGIVVNADDISSNILFYNDVSTNSINVPDAMIKYQDGGLLTTQTTEHILSTAKIIQHDSSGGTLLMNSTGTTLNSSGYLDVDISGEINFYTDTGFIFDSSNDFIINCSGTLFSLNDLSCNLNSTGNIIFSSFGQDGLGGNIILDSSGGVIEFNSGDIKLNTLLKFSPPERGVSNELLHNETVTIYDNDNTPFLPNVYNDPTILTGNSTTFIGKDISANTFIFMNPAARKDGGAIGGGMAPHDSSRAMTVIGTTDSSGNYIPSQMTISGANKHKYISTMGINTHKPRTEDYVLDVNGPMHLGNGEINTIADNTYEITSMSFSKTVPTSGIAVGSPSTKTGSGVNKTENALLSSANTLTDPIDEGTYSKLQTNSTRPSTGTTGGTGAELTIIALENNITSITVTDSGNDYVAGDILTVTDAVLANTGRETPLIFTLTADHIVDVAEYNQILLYTNDGGIKWNKSDIFSTAGGLNTDIAVSMGYIDVFDNLYSAISGKNGNLFISNDSGQSWYKLQLKGVDTGTTDYKTINIVEDTNGSNTHRIFISYTIGDSNTGTTGIYYFDCNLSTIFTPIDTSAYLTTDTTIEIKTYIKAYESTTTTDNYYITSASSTDTRVYYAGINGAFSYDNTISYNNNPNPLKLGNISHNNNIYAFDDTHAIAVSTTGISYTTDGLTWTHKIFGTDLNEPTHLGLSTMVLNSVFIHSLSNAIAVGSQGEFIYSTDWQNGVWQMVPDALLNSSGMRDRIRGSENNLKSISMPDINTMIIADTITPFVSNVDFTLTQLGYSKIQYCFLPNLFNRTNNTVLDVSGNSTFDGHITGQATLVINDSNPNTFTVSNAAVNANTKAITLTTTDALTLTDGSVNFIMDGIGATSLRGATTFDLDASGIISINSTDADINIGNDTIMVDQAINIGTGESARTITVGNATGTTKLDIHSGTEGIDIDTTGNISVDASGNISFDAVNESNSRSIDIGKKTHIVDIGKTDEQSVIQPVINQIYNDFASVINIGVSDPIINPATEDASRVLINIGNYKQNALEGNRKSNIINIGGGKDILSLGGTITYSSTEVSTSKNKGFQINESHPLHDGIDAYINQAGNTLNMTGIVDTAGIYSYTFTNPAYNAYEFQYKSIHNNPSTHDIIVAYMAANSFNNDNIPGGSTPLSNTDMNGIALNNSIYEYSATNPDLEEYIVNTYKPYNSGAGSGIRVTDNLDRDAGYLIVSDDLNGWSMKPTKYGSNSLKIDVNSLVLRDDNGYIDGTDVSGIHDIKNGIVMLTKTDTEATNYKLSVQQIDISNILVRDSNTSTLNKQFVNTELVVQNDVSFNKDLSIGGDVFIEGQLSATSVLNTYVINTTTTDYEFIVTQDMSLGGILFVGGDASFNSNMDISGNVAIGKQNPVVTLDISGNDALRLPVGDDTQRPIKNMGDGTFQDPDANVITANKDDYIGSIRYNSDNSQFEGFGPGDNWGSLGGVINVAQNTKIMASSPNPDSSNNQLQFFTANIGTIVGALTIGTTSHPHDLLTSVSNSLTEDITAGTYPDLSTTTSGNGSGAILKIVASTNLITSVIVTTAGSGYEVGDTIAVTAAHLSAVASRNTPLNITLTANDIVNNAAERMRIDSNGNVGIGTTSPNVILDINGTDALRLPIGVTNDRPIDINDNGFLQLKGASVVVTAETKMDDGDISGYIGSIRYNTSNKQFEGFGPGEAWGSLGGVINVAQTTKITAESSPAATNNQLRFYTANSDAAQLQMIIDASSGGVAIGTGYASDVSNNTDISDNSLIVQGKVGIGTKSPNCILDINGTDALRLPVGDTNARPIDTGETETGELAKYIGSIRYNNTVDKVRFEGFGPNNSWVPLGGVINDAQNTKIIAESSAGAGNNQLQFYTAPNTWIRVGNRFESSVRSQVTAQTSGITFDNGSHNPITVSGGSGTGATVNYTIDDTATTQDKITSFNFNPKDEATNTGMGYRIGDILTIPIHVNANTTIDVVITLVEDDLGLSGNGLMIERMIIDSNGDVGIGTSTPQSKLDVEGSVRIGSSYSGNNTITTNPANGMIVEGNVGIGTSDPTSTARLRVVHGNTTDEKNISAMDIVKDFSGVDSTTNTYPYAGRIYGTDSDPNGTTINETGIRVCEKGGGSLTGNATKVLNVMSDGQSKMVVTGAGNVGIGTTSPQTNLDISNNIFFDVSHNTGSTTYTNIITGADAYNGSLGNLRLKGGGVGSNNYIDINYSLDTSSLTLKNGQNDLLVNNGITGTTTDLYDRSFISGSYAVRVYLEKWDFDTGQSAVDPPHRTAGPVEVTHTYSGVDGEAGGTGTITGIRVTGSSESGFAPGDTCRLYLNPYDNIPGTTTSLSTLQTKYANIKITLTSDHFNGGGDSVGDINLVTNDTTRVHVNNDGNVGIGTSDTTARLRVVHGSTTDAEKNISAMDIYKVFDGVANDYYAGRIYGTDGTTVNETGIKVCEKGGGNLTSNSTKVLNVISDGDSKMIVTGAGNVGIGTNDPKSKLDVEGNVAIGSTYSGNNAAPANGMIVEGNVGIGTNDPKSKLDVEGNVAIGSTYSGNNAAPANGMIVEGNVGIGTTDPTSTARLRVVHGSTTDAEKNISAMDIFKDFNGVDSTNTYPYAGRIYGTDGTTVNETGIKVCEKGGGSLTGNSTKVLNVISDADSKMVVTGEGNVGIGTTVPGAPLHIYDTTAGNSSTLILERDINAFGDSNDGCAIEFKVREQPADASRLQSRIRGIDELDNNSNGGGIAFDTQDEIADGYDERMRISYDGKVGIGTDSPSSLLDVSGNIKVSNHILGNNSELRLYTNTHANDSYGYIELTTNKTVVAGNTIELRPNSTNTHFGNPSTPWVIINTSGQVSAVSFNATSDIRHKENIHELENALEKINAIRGVNFTFIDDDKKCLRSGIIAQEVQSIIPELIDTTDDEKWTANYDGLTPYLIESVKTLSKENETLKTKINSLETKLEMIMKHLNL